MSSSEISIGRKAIQYFYDEQKRLFSSKAPKSFDDLIKILEARQGGKNFLLGLGLGISLAEVPEYRIKSAMLNLARNSGGKIPQSNNDFRDYLINEATKVNFTDAVTFTVVESAKQIANGAQAVGESVILTGKLINYALPFIVGVLIYFWVVKHK